MLQHMLSHLRHCMYAWMHYAFKFTYYSFQQFVLLLSFYWFILLLRTRIKLHIQSQTTWYLLNYICYTVFKTFIIIACWIQTSLKLFNNLIIAWLVLLVCRSSKNKSGIRNSQENAVLNAAEDASVHHKNMRWLPIAAKVTHHYRMEKVKWTVLCSYNYLKA